MKKRIMILDGYNVIHRLPTLRKYLSESIEAGRNALLQLCAEWLSTRRDVYMFYIVFDGDSSVTEEGHQSIRNVRSIYTRTGEKADDRILDIIDERGDSCDFSVVSDDNYVRKNAKALNALIMPVQDFYDTLDNKRSSRIRNVQDSQGDKTDLTPSQKKAINDSLEEEWGL